MENDLRLDIAVRWEGTGWVAYNVGAKPPHAAWNWSTSLGPITIEEIHNLFRNSNVLFLPPGEKGAEFAELDFTVVC